MDVVVAADGNCFFGLGSFQIWWWFRDRSLDCCYIIEKICFLETVRVSRPWRCVYCLDWRAKYIKTLKSTMMIDVSSYHNIVILQGAR